MRSIISNQRKLSIKSQSASQPRPLQIISPPTTPEERRESGALASTSSPSDFKWLFSNSAASISDYETRRAFKDSLTAAMPILDTYDIRSREGRTPNIKKDTRVVEPCLTTRAIAIEASKRLRRLEDSRMPPRNLVEGSSLPLNPSFFALAPVGIDEDYAWMQKRQQQEAYLSFLIQLKEQVAAKRSSEEKLFASMATDAEKARARAIQKEDLDSQIKYQIEVADDWLQCKYISDILFSISDGKSRSRKGKVVSVVQMGAGPAGALMKKLAVLVTIPKDSRPLMSPGEGAAFLEFTASLPTRLLHLVPQMRAQQVAETAYSIACLDLVSPEAAQIPSPPPSLVLLHAVVDQTAVLLKRELEGRLETKSSLLSQVQGRPNPLKSDSLLFSAGDYASLMWSLGTIGYIPPKEWLVALCSCTLPRLGSFQPSQIWGLLWGLAKVAHSPTIPWMQRALVCAERVLPEFTAQGHCRFMWALGAMGHVPDQRWLRAFMGQLQAKHKSILPDEMVELMEGMAAIGYRPNVRMCFALLTQCTRLLHVYSASQQASIIRSIAMHTNWSPQRQFLYDFVTHSMPKLGAMSLRESSGVIWAFARLRYLPDPSYIKPLVKNLYLRLDTPPSSSILDPRLQGQALSQTLWAMATLGISPSSLEDSSEGSVGEGGKWMGRWCSLACTCMENGGFSPQCISASFWAIARLSTTPSRPTSISDGATPIDHPLYLAQALEYLLSRCSQEFDALSPMEMSTVISSLACLKYRPSDSWLSSFVEQSRSRLSEMSNQDHGLMIWSLSYLAAPVDESWLQSLSSEAGSKWWSMDLEGMSLLMWGLAQYGYQPVSREWWEGFWIDSESKLGLASEVEGQEVARGGSNSSKAKVRARSVSMLLLALSQLVEDPPSKTWLRAMNRAIRLSLRKPPSAARLPMSIREAAGMGKSDLGGDLGGVEGDLPHEAAWLKSFLMSQVAESWGFSSIL